MEDSPIIIIAIIAAFIGAIAAVIVVLGLLGLLGTQGLLGIERQKLSAIQDAGLLRPASFARKAKFLYKSRAAVGGHPRRPSS